MSGCLILSPKSSEEGLAQAELLTLAAHLWLVCPSLVIPSCFLVDFYMMCLSFILFTLMLKNRASQDDKVDEELHPSYLMQQVHNIAFDVLLLLWL